MAEPEELTPGQVRELTDDLHALQTTLQQQLDATLGEAAPVDVDEPIGRVSRIDAIAQREMAQAGRREQTHRLGRVRAALSAIESEEYGLCRGCEEPISFRRLKARPETAVCLRCQAERESRS